MFKFAIKHWKLTGIVIILGVISFYWFWHDRTFVRKNFAAYTGIEKFSIMRETYNSHQSYIMVFIEKEEREKILKKFNFKDSFDYEGNIQCPFVNDSNSTKYLFHFEINDVGQGNYTLYGLDKYDNIMFLFEEYGD